MKAKQKNNNSLYSDELCHALFEDILIHDDIYPEAVLPDKVHLDYSQQQISECFNLCLRLWQLDVKREVFNKLLSKVCQSGELNLEDQQRLKNIRAVFKHLRFAFVMLSKKHQVPLLFHGLIIIMGHLQDVIKNKQKKWIICTSYFLKCCSQKWLYSIIVKNIDSFESTDSIEFNNFINQEINFIRINLLAKKVTAKKFHDMRKVIGRQVAFYDNLKNLYPSQYHTNITEYLSTLNGMMGSLHDELIAKKFNQTQNYHKDLFEIPLEIRLKLDALIHKYQIQK
ncbi:MAG: hypothetical protein COB35_02490 [Gammaproteobacteria bacterium]|nr:MAG: hypothetical protein COB35_02490 [Gammaproteobacteria bacterium]